MLCLSITAMHHPCCLVGENRTISTLSCHWARGSMGLSLSALNSPGVDFYKFSHTWDLIPTYVRHIQHLKHSISFNHMHPYRFSLDLYNRAIKCYFVLLEVPDFLDQVFCFTFIFEVRFLVKISKRKKTQSKPHNQKVVACWCGVFCCCFCFLFPLYIEDSLNNTLQGKWIHSFHKHVPNSGSFCPMQI